MKKIFLILFVCSIFSALNAAEDKETRINNLYGKVIAKRLLGTAKIFSGGVTAFAGLAIGALFLDNLLHCPPPRKRALPPHVQGAMYSCMIFSGCFSIASGIRDYKEIRI